MFEGDRGEFDRQIEESLTATSASVDAGKTFGKQRRFRSAPSRSSAGGRTRYFLPAFTMMSATLPAHVRASIEDLEIALARTWQAINAGVSGSLSTRRSSARISPGSDSPERS